MDKNLYAIQVGNNTYIDWCDDNWYGVETFPYINLLRRKY